MSKKETAHEPLLRIVKRSSISRWQIVGIYAAAIVLALLISAGICTLFAKNKTILDYFASLINGTFGTERKRWILLQEMALLLGTAAALVPAFKMKFWNLGANGQILVGCLAPVACMHYLGGQVPEALLMVLMVVSGIAAGAIWAVIPALFKAHFNSNETLFTLMMNYIATGIVTICISIWVTGGSGILKPISYGNFPDIGNRYLGTVILFVALAVLMFVYLRYSKQGYEISVVGESGNTARYIGINVKKVVIRTMLLSGALAGLVGVMLAGAVKHTIATDTANNMGFTAIIAVWLAEFNPLIMILTCLFIAFITNGMAGVCKDFKFTNDSIANIVIAIIFFCVIACSFFINYKIVFCHKEGSKQ